MATTTNYSWTTPDDTALVKDGAAAIRSLGTAIDSTVFTNAGAAIAKTIVDAKGDIIAATAADTVSRLAVGANDTVLTADSTAGTGLKWAAVNASSITLLTTTNLSSTSTTVSGISGAYTDLIIRVDAPSVTATGDTMIFRLNGQTGSVYDFISINTTSTTWSATASTRFSMTGITSTIAANTKYFQIYIRDYANASTKKGVEVFGQDDSTKTVFIIGNLNVAGAITSVTIADNNNDTFDGGTIKIYGVK
jgi:hypothetical protein